MELHEEIEIKCKKCNRTQKYHPRSNKIPKRPKTQCQNEKCGAWIYFDESLLVKDDQRPKNKNDQKKDQKDLSKPKQELITTQKQKIQSQSDLTKTVDQRPKDIDQMTKDQKLSDFIRSISGDLIIAMNYAINAIKNKPEVVAKKQDATRYNYFINWSQYREFFRELDNEIKKEMGIIKEGVD